MRTFTIDNEEFVHITEYPSYYISTNSNIRKVLANGTIKVIQQSQNSKNNPSTNYLIVSLYVDSISTPKGKKESVHRLMALTFLPRIPGKEHVNHIDGNKLNNHITNLEWCTPQENAQHAFNTGLSTSTHCEREVHQYSLKGEYITSYKSLHEAERVTGISYQNIYKVVSGKREHAGKMLWSYNKQDSVPAYTNPIKAEYTFFLTTPAGVQEFSVLRELAESTKYSLSAIRTALSRYELFEKPDVKVTRELI